MTPTNNNVQEEDNNTNRSTKQLPNNENREHQFSLRLSELLDHFDAETKAPFKYSDLGSALSKFGILTPVLPIWADSKSLGVRKYVLQ